MIVLRLYLKEILLFAYVVKDYQIYLDRISELGITFNLFAYLFLFVALFFALITAAYNKNIFVRFAYAIIFLSAAITIDSYYKITGDYLTYNSFIILMNEKGFMGEALKQFNQAISSSIISAIILFVGIIIKPQKENKLDKHLINVCPVLTIVLLTILLYVRGGDGSNGLPGMFTPVVYSSLYFYESINKDVGERQNVNINRDTRNITHDIVLIVDESVVANYLDINETGGIETNLKDSRAQVKIYNYGYAAAITNCSSPTNVTLRYGGTRENYLRIITTMPSIWEYAKEAGLITVFIDTQRTNGKLQNKMDERELKYIDQFVQYDDTLVVDRDMYAAKTLVEHLNNEIPEFIMINKMGAHFPVNDKYPDEYMRYRPVLPRGDFVDISDTGSRKGFGGTAKDWEMYRNSYKNTLRWNVGRFFEIIFSSAKIENAIILYTSDHGQDLHETGNYGTNTHCGSSPNSVEGLVPLVLIEGSKLNTLNWEKHFHSNKNNSSHYNLFPTLLVLMGYNEKETIAMYGNPLNTETNDPYTFNTRFYARLGKKPIWKKIDMAEVPKPQF